MKYLDPMQDLLESQSAGFYLSLSFLVLAFLGFLDTFYLTLQTFNVLAPCSISCQTVLSSHVATVFGLPVVLLGSLYYLFIMTIFIIFLKKTSQKLLQAIPALLVFVTFIAFCLAVYFTYIQLFILHVLCLSCLASKVIDFLLFDCAWWLWKRNKKSLRKTHS